MLPPIDESILQNNPNFAALHTTLTTTILNPNGSTKKHSAQKERHAVSEALKEARILAAKRSLLRTALNSLDLTPATSTKPSNKSRAETTTKAPPTELIEIILLLSSRLSSPFLPASSIKLLESTIQWTSLPTHLPTISALLSTHLHSQCLALVRIQSPTTNASYLHRGIPKLVPSIQETQAQISLKKAELTERRVALISTTTVLLQGYQMAISLIIQVLEGVKHGSIARREKARAEYLGVQAQVVEWEVREKGVRGEKMIYGGGGREALEGYVGHLRDGVERLGERGREARRVLWGYGVGREEGEGEGEKERVMKEIARVYGELVRELGEVGRDVERLRGK